jgi:mannose/fructose/N-acetylgalactosamine-specific phosphotransferase system component IID
MALISPSHHSTTQTGVAEQWVGEKTIPGRCVLLLFLGVGWCVRFVVVVWWCCVLLLLFVVGVVLGWCGVVLGWCGGVVYRG